MQIPSIKTYLFRHPSWRDSKPTKVRARSLDGALIGALEFLSDKVEGFSGYSKDETIRKDLIIYELLRI